MLPTTWRVASTRCISSRVEGSVLLTQEDGDEEEECNRTQGGLKVPDGEYQDEVSCRCKSGWLGARSAPLRLRAKFPVSPRDVKSKDHQQQQQHFFLAFAP